MLEVREKVFGKEYLNTLDSINNLMLELIEKVLGKEHLNILNSINNLANVLREIGKYKEAEKMHREKWKLKEEVFMKNSMDRQRQNFDS
ncbi:unnamed protein product [Fusarium fujikuroi]|nr:unnamed protein product [Fusarium fujikuroi]